MADSSGRDLGDRAAAVERVWTFHITGPPTLQLQLEKNPPLEHNGNLTLWKMVGNEETMATVQRFIEQLGCRVDVFTESQSAEQETERRRLVGLED